MGGNHTLYVASVFGQILFSGCLFLFWLVYADGMSSANPERSFCSFYLPKLILVATYVGVAASMFILHGRLPDRINVVDVSKPAHNTNRAMHWLTSLHLLCVCRAPPLTRINLNSL